MRSLMCNPFDQLAIYLHIDIVAERSEDELPCHLCEDCGSVVVLKIGPDTFDVCRRCVGGLQFS